MSFTDGLNEQATYFYHVQLTGLRPGNRYHYQVSDEAGTAHDGTTTLPATPFETFVFGRGIARGHQPGHRGARALEGSRAG